MRQKLSGSWKVEVTSCREQSRPDFTLHQSSTLKTRPGARPPRLTRRGSARLRLGGIDPPTRSFELALQSPWQPRCPCGESLMIHKIHMYVLRRDELCSRQHVGAHSVISVRLRPIPQWQARQTNFTSLEGCHTKQDIKMRHQGGTQKEGEGVRGWTRGMETRKQKNKWKW